MYKMLLFYFSFILLSACSTTKDPYQIGLIPKPPHITAWLALPPAPPKTAQNLASDIHKTNHTMSSENSNFISLMAQNGAIVTVWGLAQRNWLWVYPISTTQSFSTLRNWRLERSFRREHFRFLNQRQQTCMEGYGNGVIHNACDRNNLAQDFEILPTQTGAVVIKNVQLGKCLTYNIQSNTGYFTLTLENCQNSTSPFQLKNQGWYIAPPILPAKTLN
ncbi:hypothetical protein A4G19_08810 [Pasteurellaceae bacterium Macca]|nr:hypothetical protein [Pasteurellaceae bacterium Macca]